MKGIITADVIGSTKMDPKQRSTLPEILDKLAEELQVISPLWLEMYRGDSFQVLVEDYEKAPLIAVLLRMGLMRKSVDEKQKIDARVSVGIGSVSYLADMLGKSDGEAFLLSGRAFERISKKSLIVVTPDESLNAELAVYVTILDELLAGVSSARSKTIFAHLMHPELTMDKLGKSLGISKQAVSQSYHSTRVSILDLVLERMEYVLANSLKK